MRAAALPILLSLMTLLAAPAATAERQYAAGPTTLSGAAGDDDAGTLAVATPVSVLERQGDRLLVRLEAWHPEDNPAVLYERPGQRVVAALPKRGLTLEGDSTAATDEAGRLWRRVTLTAWVAAGDLRADPASIWNEAEAIFATRCTVCHARRVPAHYTVNQLFTFLQAMGPRAKLSRDERMLVLKYLQSQAKDAPPP